PAASPAAGRAPPAAKSDSPCRSTSATAPSSRYPRAFHDAMPSGSGLPSPFRRAALGAPVSPRSRRELWGASGSACQLCRYIVGVLQLSGRISRATEPPLKFHRAEQVLSVFNDAAMASEIIGATARRVPDT